MMKESQHEVFLALGSNLGDGRANIHRAIELIQERIGDVVRQSSLIVTEPWGFESSNSFVNGACMCLTSLTPMQLLRSTQQIEREMGRTQKSTQRLMPDGTTKAVYHDRIIDIDILTYDDLHIHTPELTLPHPHMHERDFVMIPFEEIKI